MDYYSLNLESSCSEDTQKQDNSMNTEAVI
jgi:hypothetical protein